MLKIAAKNFFIEDEIKKMSECFASGTMILTNNGMKAIDSITTKNSLVYAIPPQF